MLRLALLIYHNSHNLETMKKINLVKLFAVVMLLLTGGMNVSAQDDPCSATVLTVNLPVSGAILPGGSSVGPQAACWSDTSVEGDIWFSFIMPASGSANVSTIDIGDNDDTQVAVYTTSDGTCAGGLTEVGCNDDISNTDYMSSADVCDLGAGTYCLIQVDGWQGSAGAFDILVTEIAPCTPPTCDATDCDAGSYLIAPPSATVCPGETGTINEPVGFNVPADPGCQGSSAVIFEPQAGATGGIGSAITLFGVTFPYTFDNDLNGVLSANSLPPFVGDFLLRPAVFLEFGGGITCDSTALTMSVSFLGSTDPGCEPVECIAGDVANGSQTVCPGEPVDFTLTAEHSLPVPGSFYWFFENALDTNDFRVLNFGSDPTFYQFTGDLNGLFAANAIDTLTPGDWLFQGWNVDLVDTTICDVTPLYTLTILDSSDPLCGGGVDCSAFDTAPVDLTKSFDPVNGIQDRVQVKWFKASPQVKYTDADAAMCDIKFWAKRDLDPETMAPIGPAITNPDTVLIEDAKKTFPGTSDPREIFKWPVKFRADGVNNAKRANPNIRYEWKVRCECGHDGAGPESPWSDVKIFNVPNFDPTTGIYTPPPGAGEYTDGEVVVKSLNTLTLGEKLTLPTNMKNKNTGKLLLKKRKPRKASKSISQSAAVKLYPNPANDVLNIVLDGEATYVRIVDMAGRIIHQERGNGNMLRMDISDLSEGMYTVVLEVNGAISHSPFVVKK